MSRFIKIGKDVINVSKIRRTYIYVDKYYEKVCIKCEYEKEEYIFLDVPFEDEEEAEKYLFSYLLPLMNGEPVV